jgi:hypothetical protein
MYRTTMLFLAAGADPVPVEPSTYQLPPQPPASARITPGRCPAGSNTEIVVCGRRDERHRAREVPLPPGVGPSGSPLEVDLGGGATGRPEASAGYQDGWPDKRVVFTVKVPF